MAASKRENGLDHVVVVTNMDAGLLPLDQPLSPLAQALVAGCLALAGQLGQPCHDQGSAALNGAEGTFAAR